MAAARRPQPVKLFAGLIGPDEDRFRRARQLLLRRYGPADLESELWPFDATDYYEPEMGPSLQRCFLSFERLINPDQLAAIKLDANALEQQIADELAGLDLQRPRPINIDPGYVDLGKLVLATTKDRAHRIYLGEGIFAEVTLQFIDGAWRPSHWTFPDFAGPRYHAYFIAVRARLKAQREHLAALLSGSGGKDA